MKKLFSILFYLVLSFAIIIVGAVSYHYYKMPIRTTPAPYEMAKNVYTPDDIASNVDILIVGDDMGVSLGPYISDLTTELSKKLARPLSFYSIASNDESLYRTVQKVKALKKVPKILILASGYSEMQEDLYPKSLSAQRRNNLNFKIYNNLYIQSLIKFYPELSRLFFLPENLKKLNQEIIPIDYTNIKSGTYRNILKKEVSLYESRLEEFLRELKALGTSILIVVPPINIELEDLRVCEDTTNDQVEKTLKELAVLLSKSRTKEAQILVQEIEKKIVANSYFHQLRQELFEKQGSITNAYEQALLKLSFACEVKSSHPIFIKTLENVALNQSIATINFNEILKQSYTRAPLFISKKTPQSVYFPKLVKELIIKLKQIMQLK